MCHRLGDWRLAKKFRTLRSIHPAPAAAVSQAFTVFFYVKIFVQSGVEITRPHKEEKDKGRRRRKHSAILEGRMANIDLPVDESLSLILGLNARLAGLVLLLVHTSLLHHLLDLSLSQATRRLYPDALLLVCCLQVSHRISLPLWQAIIVLFGLRLHLSPSIIPCPRTHTHTRMRMHARALPSFSSLNMNANFPASS